MTAKEHTELVEAIESGEQELDFLCIEGSVIRGPGGTGMYDTVRVFRRRTFSPL